MARFPVFLGVAVVFALALSQSADCAAQTPAESLGLAPLTELTGKYKGEDGGLYGEGRNQPPQAHAEAALRAAERIRPLDAQGKPSAEGKIVVVSIGMSNTHMEFTTFQQLADRDPEKSPRVLLVDGAQGSRGSPWFADAERIDPRTGKTVWGNVDDRLVQAGATPLQVQAVWIKQTAANPAKFGDFPAHARELESHLTKILQIAKQRYPNLQVAYLSSRIYAGYANKPLSPEPYAYENAFAVRWTIQKQMAGDAALNFDPARGEVKAPLALWGPYLWGDGRTPRQLDKLTWEKADLAEKDGTHPSDSGREKVARLLLDFLKTDPSSRPWFVAKQSP